MTGTRHRFQMLMAILVCFLSATQTRAIQPAWSYSAPTPAVTVIAPGATSTINYTVTNHSNKSKNLILNPQITPAGLSASPCHLAAYKGSSCTLIITVDGSTIPQTGIIGGPSLCEKSNPNQCYRVSQGNELNINVSTGSIEPWVTNGDVYAIIYDNPNHLVYLGGDFTEVSQNMGQGIPMSTATGAPIPAFSKVHGVVFAATPDNKGGWYIGGNFTNVDNIARNNLAHINSDNTLDLNFNLNVNGTVRVLSLDSTNNLLYAGGDFTSIDGGTTRNHLASFNATSGAITSFDPNMDNAVYALSLDSTNNLIYAGGVFTSVNGGATRNYLASFNTTSGAVTSFNPNMNSKVYALSLDSTNNLIYAGGYFTSVNGSITRNYLASFNVTSGAVSSFDPNLNNVVYALSLESTNNLLYAGGYFTSVNDSTKRNRLASFNATSGAATSFDPNMNSTVYALSLDSTNNLLYAGGDFTSLNASTTRNNLASFNTTSGVVTSFDPNMNSAVYVLSLDSTNNLLYAGGDFTSVNDSAIRNHLASFDTTSGTVTSFDPNIIGRVFALSLDSTNNLIYAGGYFTSVKGGTTRNYLASFNTTTGVVTSFDPNMNSTVYALSLDSSNNLLYAAGFFTSVNGSTTRNHLASFNATSGAATSFDPNLNSNVYALSLDNTNNLLYAGGFFTSVNGSVTRNHLASFDVTSGAVSSFDPNLNNVVYALSLESTNNLLYAGGVFTSVNGNTTRNHLASFNVTSGAVTSFDPNLSSGVYALSFDTSNNLLYAGGGFINAGITSYAYWAVLAP